MNDTYKLSDTTWNSKYHIVFAAKYWSGSTLNKRIGKTGEVRRLGKGHNKLPQFQRVSKSY